MSEALLFAEHGENMLCTKIVLNARNNFCTQHVLPRFELRIFMYWTCNSMNNLSSNCGLNWCKNKSFWQRFTCTVALYYNTVIAWCLYYFGQSFSSPLPWSQCPKILNETLKTFEYSKECGVAGSTQFFWYRETLDIAANITEPSSFNFTLAFCLLLAWILVRMSCKRVQNHC